MVDILPVEQRVAPNVRTRNRVAPGAFRNANAAAGLAQVAGAASQVALTVDRKEQERLQRERQSKLGALRNQHRQQSTLGLLEDFQTAKQNAQPGADGFYDGFKDTVAQRREQALSMAGDDQEARQLIEQDYDRLSLSFLADAQEFQAAERVSHRADVLDGSLDALGNAIVSSPDRFDDYFRQGMDSIEAASSDLSPDGRRKLTDDWKSSAAMAAFNGGIEEDPYQALRDAEGGRFDKLWSPEVKARAINAAQSEIKRREADARARQAEAVDFRVADLEIAVRRGQAGEQEIIAARESGLFDDRPQKFAQLVNIADTILTGQTEIAEKAALLQAKMASGMGLDSQDEADQAWASRVAQLGEDDEQLTLEHVGLFAEQTGFVPTATKRIVENAERVDNPEQLAVAAQAHDVVSQTAPGADSGAGDRVALVSALVNDAGMSYDEAATQVLARAPDSSVLSERKTIIKDEKKSLDFDEEAASRIPGLEGFFGGNRTSPGIASEMERRFDQLYMLSGDKEMALSAAAKQMEMEWGPSEFRDGAAMRFPPERFMPSAARNLGAEKFRAIVDDEIRPTLTSKGIEGEYLLEPDVTESRKRISKGEGPVYRVMVPNDFGAMIPLADESGDLVLYSLPGNEGVADSKTFKSAVSEQEKSLDARRESKGKEIVKPGPFR